MQSRSLGLALALSVSAFGVACRSTNAYEVGRESDSVDLVVQNDNFAEMDIYAIASGLATRVGSVQGLATERFALNSSVYNASDLRIVGAPVGGNGRASTGPIVVHRGSTIRFTIANLLAASSVSIQ